MTRHRATPAEEALDGNQAFVGLRRTGQDRLGVEMALERIAKAVLG